MPDLCFHCRSEAVVWDSDFDFEDYNFEGEGIVHVLHCSCCGAEILYKVPIEVIKEETNGNTERSC